MPKTLKNAERSSKLHCWREGIKMIKNKIISKVYIGFCQAWFISKLFITSPTRDLAWKRSMVLRKSHECVLHCIWFSFVFVSDKLVYFTNGVLIHSGLQISVGWVGVSLVKGRQTTIAHFLSLILAQSIAVAP